MNATSTAWAAVLSSQKSRHVYLCYKLSCIVAEVQAQATEPLHARNKPTLDMMSALHRHRLLSDQGVGTLAAPHAAAYLNTS